MAMTKFVLQQEKKGKVETGDGHQPMDHYKAAAQA
jgi:hypothetical protein